MELIDAIKSADVETATSMLNDGVSVTFQDANGATALHWACMEDSGFALIKQLVDNKATVSTADNNGRTALHHCAGCEAELSSDIVGLLTADGSCDPDTKDNDQNAAIHLAALEGKTSFIIALVEVC